MMVVPLSLETLNKKKKQLMKVLLVELEWQQGKKRRRKVSSQLLQLEEDLLSVKEVHQLIKILQLKIGAVEQLVEQPVERLLGQLVELMYL